MAGLSIVSAGGRRRQHRQGSDELLIHQTDCETPP